MRINRVFEGSTEIMHVLIAHEAVDPHLQVGSDVLFGDGLPVKAKAGAFYAKWFPTLTTGGRQHHGSISEFGDLANHVHYGERHARKLARSTLYAMGRHQARLEQRRASCSAGSSTWAPSSMRSRADTLAHEHPEGRQEAFELAATPAAEQLERSPAVGAPKVEAAAAQ